MQNSNSEIHSIDEYIAQFPEDIQKLLNKIRKIINEIAPEAIETINYKMPTFKIKKKNLVHFAAHKNHIGFYPTPSGVEAFKDDLKGFKYSKGAIKFPLNQPMPYNLIKKIVQFRLKEI